MAIHPVDVEIFQSGPKRWSDRPTDHHYHPWGDTAHVAKKTINETKQTILQWRATTAGVNVHTHRAFKLYVFIITLHETQHVFLKLRHPNGNAFRMSDT